MPKSDPAARAVLAYLAVKADGKGRNAYPLNSSIAHDVGMNPEVVPRVLKRLVDYGLISKDGVGPQGQPRWTMHLDLRHPDGSFDEFVRRHQSGRAGRQSRWRSRGSVDDARSSTRDDDESSTSTPVDDDESSRRRLSIVSETTMDRHVDDSKSPQISPLETTRSVLDQSPDAEAPGASDPALIYVTPTPKPGPRRDGYTTAFEAFWTAYGKKGKKAAAAVEWQKAVKRADPAVIMASVGPYVQSKPQLRWRLDAERWLKNDCWESAIVPDSPAANGYQSYRNPSDPDAYDGPLLPRRAT